MLILRSGQNICRCLPRKYYRNFFAKANYWKNKKSSSSYIIEPTTMDIRKFDPTTHDMKNVLPFISKYSTNGFKIQGNKLYGSVAILPKAFYSWKVTSAENITVPSLQLFTIVEPRIEILVIGTGEKVKIMPAEVKSYLKRHSVAVEVLDTPNACATFNFLLEEGRLVAAALIPPSHIPLY